MRSSTYRPGLETFKKGSTRSSSFLISRYAALIPVLACVLISCGETVTEVPLEPPAPRVFLNMVSGDLQTGKAFAYLGDFFVVAVTDEEGNGLEESVTWTVTLGEGDIAPLNYGEIPAPTIVTRSDAFKWGNPPHDRVRLRPLSLGTITVTAEVDGAEGSPVIFTTHVPCWADEEVAYVGVTRDEWEPPENWSIRLSQFDDDPTHPRGGVWRVYPGFNFAIPLGTEIEWIFADFYDLLIGGGTGTGRIVSTAKPLGGDGFDSGTFENFDSFRFKPNVVGVWEYEEVVYGTKGRFRVVEPPSGPRCE